MKGFRTIAIFGLSGLAYLLGWEQLITVVDPKWIAIATSVVGFVLRFVTDTPVFKKDS